MESQAVIPARGGSKGIPRKNLQTVGGVSLVGRAVRVALKSGLYSTVWVSTDSEEIAAEARMHGAEVLARPAVLAGDVTSTEEVVSFHLQTDLAEFSGLLSILQCTSPFLSASALQEGQRLLVESGLGSAFSGVVDKGFRWTRGDGQSWEPVGHHKSHRPRRQDLPPTVRETGAFYMFYADLFRAEQTRFCGETGIVIVDEFEQFEIDEPWELLLANAICPLAEGAS